MKLAKSSIGPLVSLIVASIAGVIEAQDYQPRLEAPWRAFDAGDYPKFGPYALTTGDLDSDGDQDVVIAREFFGGPGITVIKRIGDGFEVPTHYNLPINDSVKDVELLDIDGDGDLDIIGSIPDANGLTNQIGLWRNDGSGQFGFVRRFAAGEGPVELVVGDFNDDGFPDIAAANEGYFGSNEGFMSILLHNGEAGSGGGFLPPTSYDVGDNASGITAGDIDGDLDLDIVVGRGNVVGIGTHGISVLFNDGAGAFGNMVEYEQVPSAYRHSPAVVLADMNNDGHLDLLAAAATNGSPSYGVVSIRFNDSSGTFGSANVHQLAPWTFTPHSIDVADLNLDGFGDILVTTPSGRANDGFNVLLSDGSGGYLTATRYDAAKQAFGVETIDFDGDGDLDVLSVANDSSVITMHENDGEGRFPILPKYPVGVLSSFIDSGDIDQDGDLDVVVPEANIYILRNHGDGSFPPAQTYNPPINPGEVRLRDLNSDGFLDLLIGPDPNAPPYHFATAINRGDGTFGPGVITMVHACQAGQIDAFDLDNDGDLDVVLTEPGSCAGQTNGRIFLARNNGDGSDFTLMTPLDPPGLPFRIGGADFDHDGFIDLATNLPLGLSVLPGNGDFTFRQEIPTSESAYDFVISDLDNDGHQDFALIALQDSYGIVTIATMRGYGDGGFRFANEFPGPNGRESAFRIANQINVDDMDGDGNPDLLTTNNAPCDLSIFRGLGDGLVQRQDRYGCGYSCLFSTIGDFNSDGFLDVASVMSLPPAGLADAVVVQFGLDPDRTETIAPNAMQVVLGDLEAGTLIDLLDSDDSSVQVGAFSKGIVVDVDAVAPLGAVSEIVLLVEGTVDAARGVRQEVYLMNFESAAFDQVDGRVASGSDSVSKITLSENANRYIEPGTGLMKLRVVWKSTMTGGSSVVPFVPSPWSAALDHIQWRLNF